MLIQISLEYQTTLRGLTLVVGIGVGESVGGGVDTVGEVVGLGCYRV